LAQRSAVHGAGRDAEITRSALSRSGRSFRALGVRVQEWLAGTSGRTHARSRTTHSAPPLPSAPRSAGPPMTHARSKTTHSAPPRVLLLRPSAGPPVRRSAYVARARSRTTHSAPPWVLPLLPSAGPPVRRSARPPPTTTSPAAPRTPPRNR
jgi:hypothetical protein